MSVPSDSRVFLATFASMRFHCLLVMGTEDTRMRICYHGVLLPYFLLQIFSFTLNIPNVIFIKYLINKQSVICKLAINIRVLRSPSLRSMRREY